MADQNELDVAGESLGAVRLRAALWCALGYNVMHFAAALLG